MAVRTASILAMFAFVVCLAVGGFSADNPFGTTVGRALVAMAGTFVIGWVVGWMIEKMNAEPVPTTSGNKLEAKTPPRDR